MYLCKYIQTKLFTFYKCFIFEQEWRSDYFIAPELYLEEMTNPESVVNYFREMNERALSIVLSSRGLPVCQVTTNWVFKGCANSFLFMKLIIKNNCIFTCFKKQINTFSKTAFLIKKNLIHAIRKCSCQVVQKSDRLVFNFSQLCSRCIQSVSLVLLMYMSYIMNDLCTTSLICIITGI